MSILFFEFSPAVCQTVAFDDDDDDDDFAAFQVTNLDDFEASPIRETAQNVQEDGTSPAQKEAAAFATHETPVRAFCSTLILYLGMNVHSMECACSCAQMGYSQGSMTSREG